MKVRSYLIAVAIMFFTCLLFGSNIQVLLTLLGDVTGTQNATVVAKIDGTSIPVNSAADQTIITTAAATGSWASVPLCTTGLTYSTATHLFGCASGSPSGAAGGDLSGTYPNPTVAQVNGVAYPASPATNTVPLVTASNTITYTIQPLSILLGTCTGTITNNATVVLYMFQTATVNCVSTTSVQGPPFRAGTWKNLRVFVKTPSATAGGGITTVFKNGSAQTVTCTLGTGTSCQDLTHTFTTVSNDQVVIKIASAGGAVTGGPTYASGSSACTNGTQIVTFTNNTSGTNATGTITITATVPVGAVTMTTGGTGYASGTPPTTGTIATCTGTATFTGGTVTVDALGDIFATVEVQ